MVNVIVYVEPGDTVSDALSLMRRRYIHSVIVRKTPESPEYGIITSTDISDKIIAGNLNPAETLTKDVMTSPLVTVQQNLSLKECSKLMNKLHIHHLPVVDEKGDLVGMISATDFLVAAEAMGRAPGEKII
jgi:CBS domain-containing protein